MERLFTHWDHLVCSPDPGPRYCPLIWVSILSGAFWQRQLFIAQSHYVALYKQSSKQSDWFTLTRHLNVTIIISMFSTTQRTDSRLMTRSKSSSSREPNQRQSGPLVLSENTLQKISCHRFLWLLQLIQLVLSACCLKSSVMSQKHLTDQQCVWWIFFSDRLTSSIISHTNRLKSQNHSFMHHLYAIIRANGGLHWGQCVQHLS